MEIEFPSASGAAYGNPLDRLELKISRLKVLRDLKLKEVLVFTYQHQDLQNQHKQAVQVLDIGTYTACFLLVFDLVRALSKHFAPRFV